ncbi:HGxxPAAW family protein [Sphaerisporangium aureirubrum]|uniref:HGxxPAAW family protein n=1 Tax=Sphaerisporangium aureirubrum TaxID=1544736 RepID=A0ABW1NW94_9ACTN
MADSAPAQSHGVQSHAGRPTSWLAVTVILLGFTIGGVALTIGPNWFLFWVGVGVTAIGGVLALIFDIFSDVIEDAPRTIAVQEHHSPFERTKD